MLSRVIVVVVCAVVMTLTLIAVGTIEPESQTAAIADGPFIRRPLEPLPNGWDRSEIHEATRREFPAPSDSHPRCFAVVIPQYPTLARAPWMRS